MIIMKFGGTSVGTPETIGKAINIVKSFKKDVNGVVVSAFTKVTDQLIEMAKAAYQGDKNYEELFTELAKRHHDSINKLISNRKIKDQTGREVDKMLAELKQILLGVYLLQDLSLKALDLITSFGERFAAYIIAQAFSDRGMKALFVDTRKLIKTNRDFGQAKVNFLNTNKNIQAFYQKSHNRLKIITGFIASTDSGETITLGRGGSDYTASIFGAALNSSAIEIWTDVNGVMDADPRKIQKAKSISSMTYKEAHEMCHFGAKVIFPGTMIPAMEKNIPIIIKNTFNPGFKGTVISQKKGNHCLARGISSIDDVSLILIQGSGMVGNHSFAGRLFSIMSKNNINIIFITQASSEYTICFAISPKEALLAETVINEEFKYEIKEKILDKPVIKNDHAIIALVGENMRHTPGIAGRLFNVLGENKINIVAIAQGSSERNISMVVEKKDEIKTLNVIHQAFFN